MYNIKLDKLHLICKTLTDLEVSVSYLLGRSDAQLNVGWMKTFCRMHCICRSDEQPLLDGCTPLVSRMHNFCRSDAKLS